MVDCPCCGQTLPPDLPAGLVLRGRKKSVYEHVRKAGKNGIATEVLFDRIYRDDPNGGPITGPRIIAIFVWDLNRKIAAYGQRIVGGRTGHGVYTEYKLVPLDA